VVQINITISTVLYALSVTLFFWAGYMMRPIVDKTLKKRGLNEDKEIIHLD